MEDFPSIFRLAECASQYSNHPQHKMGAVITIKNKPIAIGYNKYDKSHPCMGHKKTHAELSAILSVRNKQRLKGATMIVFRRRKDGSLGNARPCERCQELLDSYGFKTFLYTTDNGWCTEARTKKKFNYKEVTNKC